MIRAYLLGNRLERFVLDLLPQHPQYPSHYRVVQEQQITVKHYVAQMAVWIDQYEHERVKGEQEGRNKLHSTNKDDTQETPISFVSNSILASLSSDEMDTKQQQQTQPQSRKPRQPDSDFTPRAAVVTPQSSSLPASSYPSFPEATDSPDEYLSVDTSCCARPNTHRVNDTTLTTEMSDPFCFNNFGDELPPIQNIAIKQKKKRRKKKTVEHQQVEPTTEEVPARGETPQETISPRADNPVQSTQPPLAHCQDESFSSLKELEEISRRSRRQSMDSKGSRSRSKSLPRRRRSRSRPHRSESPLLEQMETLDLLANLSYEHDGDSLTSSWYSHSNSSGGGGSGGSGRVSPWQLVRPPSRTGNRRPPPVWRNHSPELWQGSSKGEVASPAAVTTASSLTTSSSEGNMEEQLPPQFHRFHDETQIQILQSQPRLHAFRDCVRFFGK